LKGEIFKKDEIMGHRLLRLLLLFVFLVFLIPLIFTAGLKGYKWFRNYDACTSLESISKNEIKMKYLSRVLESYFNTLSAKDKMEAYKSDLNGDVLQLYDTTSILDSPSVDGEILKMNQRIYYYISFANREASEGFKQIGISVQTSYLVFNVLPSIDGKIRMDWKNPVVECSNNNWDKIQVKY
jgi:hypothetical protein